MPGIKTHCAQAALSSAAIYPFAGGGNAALFGLSIVLIDIDHVIEYVRQTGSAKLWGVFPYCEIIWNNLHRGFYVLNLFHTIEFMLLLGLLGLLHPVFFYVLAGALWHYALDIIVLAKHQSAFIRAFSIFEYWIKGRYPSNILRFQEVLCLEGITMPNDSWNYPAWIKHWQHCKPLC